MKHRCRLRNLDLIGTTGEWVDRDGIWYLEVIWDDYPDEVQVYLVEDLQILQVDANEVPL